MPVDCFFRDSPSRRARVPTLAKSSLNWRYEPAIVVQDKEIWTHSATSINASMRKMYGDGFMYKKAVHGPSSLRWLTLRGVSN